MTYYGAIASLVDLFEDILVRDRYPNFLRGKEMNLRSLHEKYVSLQILLQEYSYEQVEVDDHVGIQVRDVSYQAQDVIELQIYREETTHVLVKVFHGLISACQNALSWQSKSQDWNQMLMQMIEEVDLVVQKVKAFRERWIDGDSQPESYSLETNSSMKAPVGDEFVIGLDKQIDLLKEQLFGHEDDLECISITGMAGIGKTTLARNIFNDALIQHHFRPYVWVTVSHIFSKTKVFESILRSLGEKMDELNGRGEDALAISVYQHLYGRRYLIVFDDMWSTDAWDSIRRFLPDNKNGSGVIITTRIVDVARYVSRHNRLHHEMHLLNQDHSWNLFRRKVFVHDDCPPELEDIGKSIVLQCNGLPLSIVIIAGIISNNKTQKYWEDVATNVSTTLMESSEDLTKILSLSYNHLRLQHRPCFLFMGIFPEDYEIDAFVLKQMWIAEGFLKAEDESTTLEEMAEECLRGLVQRNLVSINRFKKKDRILSCTLHDMVREFCQERAFHEGFFDVEQEDGYSHSVEVDQLRRINLKWERGRKIYLYNIGTLVRSILWFGARFHHDYGSIKWDRCELLRILHVPHTRIWSLPDAIFQMIHLKYLTLNVFETDLPGSLSMLRNLQTLVIDVRMGSYAKLPPEFWTMTQLRHCLISAGMFLPPISSLRPIPARKLKDLQTLMTVIDFIFTADSIRMIPNLKKLGIGYGKYCSSGGNKWEMNSLNNLVHLSNLDELSIRFSPCSEQCIESFPTSFSFPMNLRDVTLSGCQLLWEDVTKIGSLPRLEVLRLSHEACVGEIWKPIQGEFLELKVLLMEWLDLILWEAEDCHFPSLEHLEINACHGLERIPYELGDIGPLESIHVYDSRRAGTSAIEIQEWQRNQGHELQVKVQGRVVIDLIG